MDQEVRRATNFANRTKFPEVIDRYFDDAFGDQWSNEKFKRLYREQGRESVKTIKELLDSGNAFYQNDIDDAIANVQGTSERLGFLIGFRYAIKMMHEVYE